MVSVIFSACSLVYLLIVLIVYFIKPKVKSHETTIYSWMLVTMLIGLIIDISGYFALQSFSADHFINRFISKTYLVYYFMWGFLLCNYVVVISTEQDRDKYNEDFFNKLIKRNIVIMIVNSLLLYVLPLNIIPTNDSFYSRGLATSYLFFLIFIMVIVAGSFIVKYYKKINKKKIVPIIVFVFSSVVLTMVQAQYPQLLLMTIQNCLVTTLMYFTIENPDVKMIEQLDFAKKQADKANQAKTDFLSNMSHEIRTPLNAIVGFSQALSEEDCLNDQAKDEVKDIMMASENLLEIVNGILDISKIESGKLEIIAKDYSFKKLWNEVVALGRGRLGDKPLEFKTFYDESIPEVLYGDSTRIKEVIVNLLTNAIKYTKEGFVELKVSSVIKDDICRLIISVEDSGIGIKQENIEKLFTKFERIGVEKEITIEGTGLGLAITKKLVDLMNGTIVVQSIYGKGSKFTVSIDQKIQVGHHIEETQNVNLEEMVTADLSNKRVLVVDDNMVNLKVAARLLKDYNLIIEEVDNGMDCINKVMSDTKYDLILMDDMMPKMSGTETLHNLKDIDGFNIPTIALTANAISGMKEKYLSEGFNDYLAKPIDRKELNKIIKKFLIEGKSE